MKTITDNLKQKRYACRADKRRYRRDRRADNRCNRHDRRADKGRYRHDRRADSQFHCKAPFTTVKSDEIARLMDLHTQYPKTVF